MSEVSESAVRMKEIMKKAIKNGKLTSVEYQEILAIADEDRHHDEQEKSLLSELQEMISDGSVERVS